MHHIIYRSTASWPMTDTELAAPLRQTQPGNERAGTTGALVCGAGQLMQITQGEQAALEALYTPLGQGRRHSGPFKLADRVIAERRFSDWSMGFRSSPRPRLRSCWATPPPTSWRSSYPS